MSATKNVLQLLDAVNQDADPTNELQSTIASDVFFKRCSVNLLIGKRGSGKTFNALREVMKLNWVPDHGGYSRMLYVSNSIADPTYERFKPYIPLKTIKCR